MFAGGVKSVKFDVPGGTFAAPILALTELQLKVEGQQWPAPELVKDQVGNGQGAPTGERVPFSIKAINVVAANADALRAKGFAVEPVDMQIVSKDGKTTMVLKNVIIGVQTTPIVEFGKYGFVSLDGEAVAAGSERAFTTTTTP